MPKRLFIMCGVAFSGKTTLAKRLVSELGCAHVSLDEITAERGMFGGEGLLAQEWEHSHQLAQERMQQLMLNGQDIVFDDTNCFRWLRDGCRKLAHKNGYSTELVFLDVPVGEIRLRVAENSATSKRRSLKPEVLENHLRSFEKPQEDEDPIVLRNPTDTAEWFRSILDIRTVHGPSLWAYRDLRTASQKSPSTRTAAARQH